MRKNVLYAAVMIGLATYGTTYAQTPALTDPFDKMLERAAANNPNFQSDLQAFQADIAARATPYELGNNTNAAYKPTGSNRTIPVVFHVVLTTAQMTQMGGQAAIIARIQSQLEALNADFNADNADSTGIPGAFKPLYADMNLRFALAIKDPQGNPTPGYEFITTTKTGFDADGSGTMGSHYYCSDAKYAASGGADAWDAKKYFNVWVTNITPNGVGGVGTPPPYAIYGGTNQFPWAEQGVVLLYSVLGKRVSPSDYFFDASVEKGRTLVHEGGHFFNLFHPFGISTFDNSNCQDDDGVTDTPPQAAPTQSYCPVFPLTDGCSPNSPGIMFVNHMDYEAQACALMFSLGQRARVYVETENAGGFRYELLQHPELTGNATSVAGATPEVAAHVYPNPASDYCSIVFSGKIQPASVAVINSMGQVVIEKVVSPGATSVKVDVSQLAKGIYTVRGISKEGAPFSTMLSVR